MENQDVNQRRQSLQEKPTDELIQIALTASDEEDNIGWDAIWELRYRATRDVFEAAKRLIESSDPKSRTVGVDILAQLGIPTRTFLDETLTIFFHLIEGWS